MKKEIIRFVINVIANIIGLLIAEKLGWITING